MAKKIVIKLGGNALNKKTVQAFSRIITKLPAINITPIIVHGGGPQIDAMLKALGIAANFIGGLRFTDKKTLSATEMVLSGQVNKMLVQSLEENQTPAVGISGKDGKTLIAEKLVQNEQGETIDLGFVGKVNKVNPKLLNTLIDHGFTPVISPLAYGEDGYTYNINADYAAAAIAKAVHAEHFVIMTNISGLLDANNQIIHHASCRIIYDLINNSTIQGGMIPKTLSAMDTLSTVGEINIIDGRHADNLLAVLSGQKVGTTIVN
ncbi:MAG: acetylglutamate kinase [Ostreibacterium sp.]